MKRVDWFGVACLLTGGLLIAVGSALPWIHNDWDNPRGLSMQEGQIAFSLGLAAIALAVLRSLAPHGPLSILVSIVALIVSTAVFVVTFEKLRDVQAAGDLLSYLKVTVGSGVYVTLVGAALSGAGSVVGLSSSLFGRPVAGTGSPRTGIS